MNNTEEAPHPNLATMNNGQDRCTAQAQHHPTRKTPKRSDDRANAAGPTRRTSEAIPLSSRRIWALGNGHLYSSWSKTKRLEQRLQELVRDAQKIWSGGGEKQQRREEIVDWVHERGMEILVDSSRASTTDEQLPCQETGWDLETERMLDRIFIPACDWQGAGAYGTMVSQVVTVDTSGHVVLTERYYKDGEFVKERHEFDLHHTNSVGLHPSLGERVDPTDTT